MVFMSCDIICFIDPFLKNNDITYFEEMIINNVIKSNNIEIKYFIFKKSVENSYYKDNIT